MQRNQGAHALSKLGAPNVPESSGRPENAQLVSNSLLGLLGNSRESSDG
jgi:hypothetical protein